MTPQEWLTASTKARAVARGFTLAEALIASVFLAVAAIGIAGTLAASSSTAAKLGQYANCQSLARGLVEEITSKSFTAQPNPGYSAGIHTRANYDDMADYDGYTDNSADGITTIGGTTIDFGDGAVYTRTAAFEYRTTPGGSKVSSGDFGMITVTVTSNGGPSVTLQRLVSVSALSR